jgi:hypothetical protein
MTLDSLQLKFRTSVCSQIELEPLGIGEYLVHTGCTYSDGDEFHIVLLTKDEKWTLSDEGHTFMWLSYEDYKMTKPREDLLNKIIRSNSVELDGDVIKVEFLQDESGAALYSLIQAIMQVSDLRMLSVDRVMNTFLDDMTSHLRSSEFADRCRFGEQIKTPKGTYSTDVLIDGDVPIVMLGVTNVLRCKEAMITILGLTESGGKYKFIVVIDEETSIPNMDRARLMNRADRPIIGIDADSMDRMENYIREVAGSNSCSA